MAAAAHLIDLTRLVSRQGHSTLTGIDRVELAWLRHLLSLDIPLFALVQTAAGVLLLPRAGAAAVAEMAQGHLRPEVLDLLSRLTRRHNPARGRAETALRALALARRPVALLAPALRRHLPEGGIYLNLGHAALSPALLQAVGRAGLRRVVMIHDTIPLDHPAFSRPAATAAFAEKLAAVSRHADRVIHLSHATRRVTEARLAAAGRVPPGIVAPLGITVAPPDPQALPPGIDLTLPYFVALGTVEPRKDHALLLDVWDRLAQDMTPLPRLFILGARGWAGPELIARLDARPAGVVELPGLSDGAVSAVLVRAAALVFPSRVEGFGLPPMEAALLGASVIASDLPVLREILGDYPVYAKPGDLYVWEQAIRAKARAGTGKGGAAPANLPKWEEHFRAVLTSD